MMETMTMTEDTPMITPIIVSDDRSLFAARQESATFTL